jgi:NADPH2:quinone reductase
MMRQWQIENSQLVMKNSEIPNPKDDEILIQVEGFSLNRADVLQIEGLYDAVSVPGLEVCGTNLTTGEKVCALLESGGYAQYATAKKNQTIPLPSCYSIAEGAALLESAITVYMNLKKMSPLPGQSILIHGGSSGIGTMAIQMCRLMGLKIIASAGSDDKLQACLNLGADIALNYHGDFHTSLNRSVDMIIDILGGDIFTRNIQCLAPYGKICVIAVMAGSNALAPLGTMLMRNVSLFFSTLRSLNNEAKASLIKSYLRDFAAYMNNGTLRPIIDSTFAFSHLPDAIDYMRKRQHFGKIVVMI